MRNFVADSCARVQSFFFYEFSCGFPFSFSPFISHLPTGFCLRIRGLFLMFYALQHACAPSYALFRKKEIARQVTSGGARPHVILGGDPARPEDLERSSVGGGSGFGRRATPVLPYGSGGRGLRDLWYATTRCVCLAAESRAHSRRTPGTGATNPATRRSRQASAKSELEMLVVIGADPDSLRDHSGRRRGQFETSKMDSRIRGNLRLPPEALAPKIFSDAHIELRDSWPEKALYSR